MAKGHTNNPNGRPPKGRALTEILALGGDTTLRGGAKSMPATRLLARLAWQGAATGRITFPAASAEEGERTLYLDVDQWLALSRFLYTQIDGAPKSTVELNGPGGGPVAHTIEIVLGQPAPEDDGAL